MNDQPMSELARYDFFQQHEIAIRDAYANRDLAPLLKLASSDDYRALFGEMGFAEAQKRYMVAPTCPSCGGEIHVAELRNDRMTSIRRYCERCGYSTAETWPVKLPPQDAD